MGDDADVTPGATPTMIAGRYRLGDRLGWGGCSEVWSATDEVLHRPVAVKQLLPHHASDPERVDRFRREAVALARVNHPGVIAVFDTVDTADCHAIVMELASGHSLRARLDDVSMLAPSDVIDLGIQLFDALEAAHRHGLVHHDVTPENVLIADDGTVRLADFGLAHDIDTTDHAATPVGTMNATAAYVAPEQVAGNAVDPRADIYSASVVLFEAACGEPPFRRATDAATMLARLQHDPPDPRDLRPALPDEFARAVLSGLARDPDQRCQRAEDMASALRAAAVTGRRPSPSTAVGVLTGAGAASASVASAAAPKHSLATLRRGARSVGNDVTEEAVPPDAPSSRPPGESGPSPIRRHWNLRPDRTDPAPEPTPRGPKRPRSARRSAVITASILLLVGTGLLMVALVRPVDRPAITAPAPAEAGPLRLTSITTLDPEGTGPVGENDSRAPRLIDLDPESSWMTERYLDQRFGTKSGVGVAITLEQDSALVDLTISSRSEDWRAEVSAAASIPSEVPGSGRVVNGGIGDTTVDLRGMQGSVIVIWITQLGLGSGGYSVDWSEVRVTGRT